MTDKLFRRAQCFQGGLESGSILRDEVLIHGGCVRVLQQLNICIAPPPSSCELFKLFPVGGAKRDKYFKGGKGYFKSIFSSSCSSHLQNMGGSRDTQA